MLEVIEEVHLPQVRFREALMKLLILLLVLMEGQSAKLSKLSTDQQREPLFKRFLGLRVHSASTYACISFLGFSRYGLVTCCLNCEDQHVVSPLPQLLHPARRS